MTYNPSDGLLYAFDYGNGQIDKVSSTGTVSLFVNLPGAHNGVFVGSDLFVTDNDSGGLYKVTSTGVISPVASGLGHPLGIAYDGSNFYVTDNTAGTLTRVTTGGATSLVASGLGSTVADVQYDATTGNLLVANPGLSTIFEVTPGGVVTTYANGVPSAYELRFPRPLATPPDPAAVPEPASLSLLVVGLGALFARRRFSRRSAARPHST